ncbi:Transcriptional regulator [uncultured Sporomusa sp.]|uniref:Transcriptional regulator n=1 Tax=uncultured Sporomusa sp. TaxID=307249 RepID=A0A212LMH9_9FIRM|nr:histidine kinase [uncultured Sporomusa sp.]SCM78728.1 Transcriptional regulator [uncultured Sporomusa sp.]
MQNSNIKANKFQDFLTANQITCFGVQAINDELHTVIFRTNLEIGGQQLPVMFVTDDTLHTPLQVRVVPAVAQEASSSGLFAYINELNRTYKSFKYFISEDDALILDVCLTAVPEQFEPQLVNLTLDVILRHLQDEYPVLMRKIWADTAQN